MRKLLTKLTLCLLMGTATAWAGENQAVAKPASVSPEDEKVVAVLELLQLMDLAEEFDMVKDLEFLIEDDQDEQTTN